ncbi:pantetheinase-like isoform X2 [Leptotrombidium deliense]|uniref:Pantetheinase-like isoform X2 n=1 Tax=Leptotrombidium deliense TaxID=299467 RepID=A0A443RZC1_9ACAR|nr:pantetheinase-like isoform X2 [Leptotrombidium deliense]
MGEVEYCNHTNPRCPKDGRFQYNVAVAFDSDGFLVAKYRKYHLYGENDHYNFPEKQEFATFDTPFGRIGLFVCFDSLFKYPAVEMVEKYNITTLALPTWWFNEMPFLVAHEYQQSIAIGLNVNLLAANTNDPDLGSSGSGIYNGKKGALVYSYNEKQTASLLIATLSINAHDETAVCEPKVTKYHINVGYYGYEATNNSQLSEYYKAPPLDPKTFKSVKLSKSTDNITLCKEEVCCSLNYSIDEIELKKAHTYFFGVGNGIRSDEVAQWCEEMCVLYAFSEKLNSYAIKNASKFKHFKMNATFTTKYSFPSLLTNSLKLIPANLWFFNKNGNNSSMETKRDVLLISSGLYGRCYHKDPPFKTN